MMDLEVAGVVGVVCWIIRREFI